MVILILFFFIVCFLMIVAFMTTKRESFQDEGDNYCVVFKIPQNAVGQPMSFTDAVQKCNSSNQYTGFCIQGTDPMVSGSVTFLSHSSSNTILVTNPDPRARYEGITFLKQCDEVSSPKPPYYCIKINYIPSGRTVDSAISKQSNITIKDALTFADRTTKCGGFSLQNNLYTFFTYGRMAFIPPPSTSSDIILTFMKSQEECSVSRSHTISPYTNKANEHWNLHSEYVKETDQFPVFPSMMTKEMSLLNDGRIPYLQNKTCEQMYDTNCFLRADMISKMKLDIQDPSIQERLYYVDDKFKIWHLKTDHGCLSVNYIHTSEPKLPNPTIGGCDPSSNRPFIDASCNQNCENGSIYRKDLNICVKPENFCTRPTERACKSSDFTSKCGSSLCTSCTPHVNKDGGGFLYFLQDKSMLNLS